MNKPVLELQGLRKRFGAIIVTDGIDLDLRQGELHAVIGPNGAGKTSLIEQISGTIRPDEGNIFFNGLDITTRSVIGRAQLGLARSFQHTSILPGFSAVENAALAVQSTRGSSFRFFAPAAEEQELNHAAVQALARVGLNEKQHVLADALSHGERRSLEVAMVLATKPKLILLDEPLAGMGQDDAERIINLLRGMKHDHSILLIEHDMEAVFALADRISVLVYGKIVASGPPAAIRVNAEVRDAYLGTEGTQ